MIDGLIPRYGQSRLQTWFQWDRHVRLLRHHLKQLDYFNFRTAGFFPSWFLHGILILHMDHPKIVSKGQISGSAFVSSRFFCSFAIVVVLAGVHDRTQPLDFWLPQSRLQAVPWTIGGGLCRRNRETEWWRTSADGLVYPFIHLALLDLLFRSGLHLGRSDMEHIASGLSSPWFLVTCCIACSPSRSAIVYTVTFVLSKGCMGLGGLIFT